MNEILHIDHLPGRTLTIDSKAYLYCSGTSYLGIAKNDSFGAFLKEGMEKYGTNYSSSRLSNLQLKVFEEAEDYIATYTGAEAALTMSSGFLTGQMVVRLLQGTGKFIYAPRAHPAVWLQASDFFDGDFDSWVLKVMKVVNESHEKHMIIIANSLDPLLAKRYNFDWVKNLPKNKEITLLIDDSHGFGIIGKNGAGIFTELSNNSHIRLIVISSFGKAFGIPGGVILSDKKTIETFTKNPFFGGSSPSIPAYLYAFLQAKDLYQEERKQLFHNIRQFSQLVADLGLFQYIEDYPVFYTSSNKLCLFLRSNQVIISSFPYPSPQDEVITRVIINSLHTAADIDHLVELMKQFSNTMYNT